MSLQQVKNEIIETGTYFPSIVITNPEECVEYFTTNLTNRQLVGKVQMIIADPCEYILKECNVLTEEIGPIVCAGTKLLREGDHIFVKTTMIDAGSIMRAFRAKKDEAGRSVFTVENHPIILTTKPEERRGRLGKQGPATVSVTVFLVHAIRNGLISKKEAHRNTDIRNHGHTDSVYHAYTNIIDAALEMTKNGYSMSLSGAKEIIDRYSIAEDIIVDLHCGKGWTAVASTCVKEARIFVGCVPNTETKMELEDAATDSLIYQVGQGEVTTGVEFDQDLKTRMIDVYNGHEYDKRYNRTYGLNTWLKRWKHSEKLPMLLRAT